MKIFCVAVYADVQIYKIITTLTILDVWEWIAEDPCIELRECVWFLLSFLMFVAPF